MLTTTQADLMWALCALVTACALWGKFKAEAGVYRCTCRDCGGRGPVVETVEYLCTRAVALRCVGGLVLLAVYCLVEALFWRQMEAWVAGVMR